MKGIFSLRQFAFTLEIPEIEDIVDRRGLFSMGAQLLELPELEDYLFNEEALSERPPHIQFIKRDPIVPIQ